jgi:hypothetical protein
MMRTTQMRRPDIGRLEEKLLASWSATVFFGLLSFSTCSSRASRILEGSARWEALLLG